MLGPQATVQNEREVVRGLAQALPLFPSNLPKKLLFISEHLEVGGVVKGKLADVVRYMVSFRKNNILTEPLSGLKAS